MFTRLRLLDYAYKITFTRLRLLNYAYHINELD